MSDEEYINILIIENQIEALLIEQILNQMDIPHLLVSYYDTAYDGLFQTQKGWGYLSAPERFKKQIIDIVKEIRSKANIQNSNEDDR